MENKNKNILIIRDGMSDFTVIKQFVKAIHEKHHQIALTDSNFYDLKNTNIVEPLGRFVQAAEKHKDYQLFSDHAADFVKELIEILHTSIGQTQKENDISINCQDVLIVYADSEKILGEKQNYFEHWAYSLGNLLWYGIERYYATMIDKMGYNYEFLPLILPLILFPSSEILVAAAMYSQDFEKETFRKLRAKPDLKQKVYGTDNIKKAASEGDLEEIVTAFIVPDSLSNIYELIPETRKFIHILSK